SGWAYLADFYKKGFAFGILIKGETAAQAYSDDLLLYSGKFQFIPSIGTGFSLIKNVLRIGYSLQWINQASGQREVLVNAPNLGFNQTLMQGCALSHNVGLEYSIAWKTISKMTGVVRNLFGANFSANSLIHYTNNPQGVPPSEPMMLDLAFSGQHRFSEKTFIRYSFGINDAFDANQVPILGRLVAGIELSLIKNFTFRGGWQLGYPTLGLDFEVNSGRHAISLAMFSRDTGSSYHELDVLRFMFQYQFKLGKKEATAARTLRLIMKEVSEL
ncbi:MAG: hypothetical protein ABIQ95_03000, partial [Bdellovibrionia bacterium]